jgi:hypothetical protein
MRRARTLQPGALSDFARFVFRLRVDAHHSLWLDALEGVARGEISKLLFIAPPGHAKSTYTSIVFPAWYLGHFYNESLIGVTTTDTLGQLYGDTVRNIIEEQGDYASVFPGVVPHKHRGWGRDGFFLKGPKPRRREQKDSSMIYTGAGGPVIGRRAEGVIVDDIVDEATARSELLLGQRKTWLGRSVFSRLQGARKGWRVIAGTLWAEDDVVDSAMQTGEYVTVHMAARADSGTVESDVWIPNGVSWRPQRSYRVVEP